MKDFLDNLLGWLRLLLFLAFPCIVIGLVALLFHFLGIDFAVVEGFIRLLVVGYFIILTIRYLFTGR